MRPILEVNALVALENENLPIEARTVSLHRLGLPCTSRIVGVSSVAQVHAMHEGQVTLVGQGVYTNLLAFPWYSKEQFCSHFNILTTDGF